MQLEPTEPMDGRVARRLENRARIVDALHALILEGSPHPTLREVAERAGVTPRTLLNHFADTDALHAAAAHHARAVTDERMPPVPDLRTSEARVREWFRRAADYYDGYAAVRWASLTFPGEAPRTERKRRDRASFAALERRVLELLDAPERPAEPEALRALRSAVDPITWRLLRLQQGLSRSDAAGVMSRAVLSLARSRGK
jgi:AcrR family transcriptional regulator